MAAESCLSGSAFRKGPKGLAEKHFPTAPPLCSKLSDGTAPRFAGGRRRHPAASDRKLEADLNPPPAPENALVPQAGAAPPADPDAPAFDPAAYKWVPVLRKPRKDGWTPQRQVTFIAALADAGCVAEAAREVGMSVTSWYRCAASPLSSPPPGDAALAHASKKLVDLAFDRSIHGCAATHPHGHYEH